jgi:adenylyl-sulfate kinase
LDPIVPLNLNFQLGQVPKVIWFTGLSGSGKTTLALALQTELQARGFKTCCLDGDLLRLGLNAGLGFSEADRNENIRRAAHVAQLMAQAGLVVLSGFISPLQAQRNTIAEIIGPENYLEGYVKCSLETCENRDVKGHYKQARMGNLPNFTGISAPYEQPENPFITINTEVNDLKGCIAMLCNAIISCITLANG